ncbi:MAG TPA: MarR family transcriptional regulator [Gammaproteobacteria bacterium]|nr:MarR family transcriptional regulator [Gammaproteobacteria bacterium]
MYEFPLQTYLRNARKLEKLVALALAEPALNLSQYRLLAEFTVHDTQTVSTLSTRLDITRPSVTQLVKQLQSMGLLRTQPDPDDQRSKRLSLTRDGKMRLKIANEYLAGLSRRLAKNCTPEQLNLLQNLEIRPGNS